jgi:5-methyltetrahydropteroyltriglutamate--homocysteine methyltransferase
MSTQRPFRADHVGSLLRPAELHEALARARRGEIDAAALRAVQDRCIEGAIRLQEAAGLQSITDGEFRRDWWHVDFLAGFDGVELTDPGYAKGFQNADEQPPFMKVTRPLRRTRPIQVADFAFVAAHTKRTAKTCMPSPAMLHLRSDRKALDATYPDKTQFWADLTAGYRAEIAELYAAGCRYLQIDDTSISMLCDEKIRATVREQGDDPDELQRIYAQAVNEALRDRPADMTAAIHTCRGNFKSTFIATGGYGPVAEIVFGSIKVDAFFLEYDDARSGGFEPLRHVPRGRKVVLGLVSSKLAALESKDELKRRIDEASKYVPLEDLCLSPQCGFSSTHHGNRLTEDDQRRKLELVVQVADEVWGSR